MDHLERPELPTAWFVVTIYIDNYLYLIVNNGTPARRGDTIKKHLELTIYTYSDIMVMLSRRPTL